MTAGDDEPDVLARRRRLGAELRRVRTLAGLSGRELARLTGLSQSKVSRIESGTAIPALPTVVAWADAVKAAEEAKAQLVALTEAVFTDVHTWGDVRRDRTHLQDGIGRLERTARRILVYEPSVVPGLLQTAEYARRVFTLLEPEITPAELPTVLAARLERQMALFEPERAFAFLITEAALRWRPGPPRLLRAQLDRVASLSAQDNIAIGLIPLDAEAVATPPHGFVLFEMDEERDGDGLAMIEAVHANLTVNDPEGLDLYRRRWSRLEHMALHGDEARTLLDDLARSFEGECR
ncbi:helix-turn-helix domain-containing protein [Actinomadura decatromicini]|uniref:Helix-turn-helix transcriptional regulator n=1 Tax=Actinomadura decatromicini TaxID=2604572 RepID=A0A5D3FG89_9ACTN|nr:helix-turn-helix transcriptional regulator [Actinomadura decatromicini]TYK46992.1 helix-turn-helix transcriptional regulator [Actinomadura decatromicini]